MVHGQKILNLNRTLAFYIREYGKLEQKGIRIIYA